MHRNEKDIKTASYRWAGSSAIAEVNVMMEGRNAGPAVSGYSSQYEIGAEWVQNFSFLRPSTYPFYMLDLFFLSPSFMGVLDGRMRILESAIAALI